MTGYSQMDVCIDAFLKQESRDCAPPLCQETSHSEDLYEH